MKQLLSLFSIVFFLFSCGMGSFGTSNLQKRKHQKGIFVKKRGHVKSSSRKINEEHENNDVKLQEEICSIQSTSYAVQIQDEIENSEIQEEIDDESTEKITKEEVREILEESHQAYLSNRKLKKEIKKKYPKDKKKRKNEYQMKRDKLGFVGFVLHFIGILPIFPLIGLILGAIALARLNSKKSNFTGTKKYALWALIGGVFGFLTSLVVWYFINEDSFIGGFF